MLKIQVDLQEEYYILCQTRSTANMRRKAKEDQHCFKEQDVKHRQELEYLVQLCQTKAYAKKENRLVPLKVSVLSHEDQDCYHEQKIIFKPLPTCTPPGMPANMKYHRVVIALTFFVIHGKLILNSLQVLLRLSLMGSLTILDSLTVLVTAQLPRIH